MADKAYLFSHTRRDANAPDGRLNVMIIAVAGSLDEAFELAGEILPVQGLELVDEGAKATALAEKAQIAPGTAHAL